MECDAPAMNATHQSNRGGSRPGAGRPRLPKRERRVTFNARIAPATMKAIEAEARAQQISQGEVIDRRFQT